MKIKLKSKEFLIVLVGALVVLIGAFVLNLKYYNRSSEIVDLGVREENTSKFFTGLYNNKENNVLFTIPEDLNLREPDHTKNYVSLYLSSIEVPDDYTGLPAIFVSFYQNTFEEERESYFINYGETAISENILYKGYAGVHIWGVNQEGPGYGQKNGVYILNKDGKALSIRYLDERYKPQAIAILDSLQL